MSSPMDRLLAELIPDGTFGGARVPAEPDTDDVIARRAHDLATAVDAYEAAHRGEKPPGPQRVVPDDSEAA